MGIMREDINVDEVDDITLDRQLHRNEFTHRLYTAYPDPQDSVRQQCDSLMDKWWPGTVPTEVD